MNKAFEALICFLIGLIIAFVAIIKYTKAKKTEGEDLNVTPHAIRFGIVFALFVIAQILLILNRH